MKATVIRCPTCGRQQKRSSDQNRIYWALLHEIAGAVKAEGRLYPVETWHLYFKSRFLGCIEERLPGGKCVVIPVSSAGLDTPEFSAFFDQVEAWAGKRGVFLADREGT